MLGAVRKAPGYCSYGAHNPERKSDPLTTGQVKSAMMGTSTGVDGVLLREKQLHGRGNFDLDAKHELDFKGEEGEHSSQRGH